MISSDTKTGRLSPGVTTVQKRLTRFHLIDPQICHGVDICLHQEKFYKICQVLIRPSCHVLFLP
jgi:hypothetical protein